MEVCIISFITSYLWTDKKRKIEAEIACKSCKRSLRIIGTSNLRTFMEADVGPYNMEKMKISVISWSGRRFASRLGESF